eukprot:NODE_6073_length_659_cov_46.541353_g6050_i0.p1 GENE.NODE_6073_length_659_cov_46.541353_g6050_i0~~NODE_6073_length_659_cov_46.541353_g6050_i0.p1  ORF type:complete len:190 (-),score=75.29 NODE_6073_length_659_cov_46.541353_g6050_i0:88-612(-)
MDGKTQSRAVFGGGRYDKLLKKFGNPEEVPCVGFGFGDCVIMDCLASKKKLPKFGSPIQDVIIPFNKDMRADAIKLTQQLRATGRVVTTVLDLKNMPKKGFQYADAIGGERAILIAPDELADGKVRVKFLRKAFDENDRGEAASVEDLLADRVMPPADKPAEAPQAEAEKPAKE